MHPSLKKHERHDSTRTDTIYHFESKADFLTAVSKIDRIPGSFPHRSPQKGYSSHESYESAWTDARDGWQWARDRIESSETRSFYLSQDHHDTLAETLQVAGYRVCVPTHLSGDPESLYSLGQTVARTPEIDIAFDVGSGFSVSDTSKVNAGIALTEMIDRLEGDGIRVSLILACKSHLVRQLRSVSTYIVVKRHEEHLNVLDCVTVCCMPDLLRRLLLAVMDNSGTEHAEYYHLENAADRYGAPRCPHAGGGYERDVLKIAGISDNRQFGDLSAARVTLNTQLREYLDVSEKVRLLL